MTFLTAWHRYLDSLYPGLWNATVAALVVFLIWLLKKVRPDLFAKLPPAVQALPAVVLSGLVSGLSAFEPTILAFLTQLIGGGIAGGAAAVGMHHMLKESPLPYGNPPKAPSSKKGPSIVTLIAICLLAVIACKSVADAVQIADDVWQVAKVLCLHDHARKANARAITVQDFCNTTQQLTPYLPAAQHPRLMPEPVELDDAGAPK